MKYDLNIWDRKGYETNYVEEGWHISVYEIPEDGAPYGSGKLREDLGFDLTEPEYKQLTLGWGPDLGGDYTSDSDFWLDVESFFSTFKDIPPRVVSILRALPE
jgi:hypothetical protein